MKNKKIITILLCAIMVFACVLTAFADDGEKNVDGVVVKITLNQENYEPGDTVEMKVSIKNNNQYPVSNVSIQYPNLPSDIEFDKASMEDRIQRIEAGGYETFTITGVAGGTASATTDGTASEIQLSPLTIGIIAGVVALILIIVVIVVIVKKKKGKDAAAIILIVALGASGIATAIPNMEVNAEVSEETMVTNSDFKRVSVHDPSIVKDPETGMYYIFGSHLAWAKSEDLISWTEFKTNINTEYRTLFGDVWDNYCGTAGGDLSGMMWAPDVVYNEVMGKWCMYMSINGNSWQSAIVLLTADDIEGPYTYVDEVVFSGFYDNADSNSAKLNAERANYSDVYKVLGEGADLTRYSQSAKSLINCIDPCVTVDDNGDHWMTYGSWSGGIYQIKLDKTTGLRDYNYTYTTELNKSDAYLGYKIAGGYYNSGEGPYIFKAGDYYYLFVSLGNLETSGGYNMRVYRSESINGPYVDQNGVSSIFKGWLSNVGYADKDVIAKYNSPIGIKIFGSYNMYGISSIQVAQGHNSAFVDDDGNIYIIYHTRFAGTSEGHQVRVHQMFINEEGWLVAAPYEYGNETLSTEGYSEDDICGVYDFVVHNPNSVYNYNNGKSVGVVGGSAESSFMMVTKSFTIGGVENNMKIRVDFSKSSGKTITLSSNGKIVGDYTGTWESEDGVNVVLTIDDVVYKGVFLKQQNELSSRDVTMTFTVLGDNVTAWGVKELTD